MYRSMTGSMLRFLINQPAAYAEIKGSQAHPTIHGLVTFYGFERGTIVLADIFGLPKSEKPCGGHFFGFHIHEGDSCGSNGENAFVQAGAHYNPEKCMHPYHAGDMPVLEAAEGRAWMAFYTERFLPSQIRGRTVIIHDMPDDYRTQPAGDAGERIACGEIK